MYGATYQKSRKLWGAAAEGTDIQTSAQFRCWNLLKGVKMCLIPTWWNCLLENSDNNKSIENNNNMIRFILHSWFYLTFMRLRDWDAEYSSQHFNDIWVLFTVYVSFIFREMDLCRLCTEYFWKIRLAGIGPYLDLGTKPRLCRRKHTNS